MFPASSSHLMPGLTPASTCPSAPNPQASYAPGWTISDGETSVRVTITGPLPVLLPLAGAVIEKLKKNAKPRRRTDNPNEFHQIWQLTISPPGDATLDSNGGRPTREPFPSELMGDGPESRTPVTPTPVVDVPSIPRKINPGIQG